MDDIIKKMLNITSYKTVEYVGGIRIFDLHSQKTPSETFPASKNRERIQHFTLNNHHGNNG